MQLLLFLSLYHTMQSCDSGGLFLSLNHTIQSCDSGGDAVLSIDIAKRMADAFEVSLDYLVGASEKQINKEMLNRIEEVDKLKPEEKKMVFTFLDAFITKTKLQVLL